MMQRLVFFLFGVFAHVMFLAVFAYMAGFVGGFLVPRSVDAPSTTLPTAAALAINVALLVGFGLQHSIMARPAFKRWWTRIVPQPIERSTYVLVSNLLVVAVFIAWQPIDFVVWDIQNPVGRTLVWTVFAAGWLLIPLVSLMINHFDLFGTRQVWLHLRGQPYTHLPFRTRMLYKRIRHPLYIGWLTAFWAIPTMTVGHLLFAVLLTGYILIAIQFEERDLVAHHGPTYAEYRKRVPMLIPVPGKGVSHEDELQQAGPITA